MSSEQLTERIDPIAPSVLSKRVVAIVTRYVKPSEQRAAAMAIVELLELVESETMAMCIAEIRSVSGKDA